MQNKQRKNPGKIFILLGVLMIVAALALVVYNKLESDRAGEAAEGALIELESIIFNNQMGVDGMLDTGDEPMLLPEDGQ